MLRYWKPCTKISLHQPALLISEFSYNMSVNWYHFLIRNCFNLRWWFGIVKDKGTGFFITLYISVNKPVCIESIAFMSLSLPFQLRYFHSTFTNHCNYISIFSALLKLIFLTSILVIEFFLNVQLLFTSLY